jgi:hypothetical protein
LSRLAVIPAGVWPPRMPVEIAAGYCGERSAEAFLRKVGSEYPEPRIKRGRRQIWWKEDLDRMMEPSPALAAAATPADVLADLLPCLARSRAS